MSLFLSAALRFGVNEWLKPVKFCLAHRPVENPSVQVYQSLGHPSLRATTFLKEKLCNTRFNRVAIGTTKAIFTKSSTWQDTVKRMSSWWFTAVSTTATRYGFDPC